MDLRFLFEVGSTLCLQVTVVIAVTFVLQRWIVDARWECRLWTACFICVIGLVTAAFLLPHRRLFVFPAEFSREGMLSVVVWQGWIAIALASVWAFGVVLSLARRAVMFVDLMKFIRVDCQPIDTAALLRRLDVSLDSPPTSIGSRFSLLAKTHLSDLSLLTSNQIRGPFCWQLHRPVIVMPACLMDEDDATLRHIMLHEIEHLRTHHPMQHFLQGVCSTLFWFHPLVWSAAQGAELTREYLCDEVAAKTAGKFGAYLRTLAKVAERCGRVSCTDVPKGTLAFGNQPSALIRRSNRLVELAEGQKRPSPQLPGFALVVLLLSAGLVQQVWLPTNVMASQRSTWSPWPSWTANVLHQINVNVRDFEIFEDRVQMHELIDQLE